MRIAISGGTGHLGRAFVDAASEAGHSVRVLSRRSRPAATDVDWGKMDLRTGEGVETGVQGVDAVVHAATDPRSSAVTDVLGSRRLAETAREAGVGHFVYVSILGVDRVPLAYYRHKLAGERAVQESGVPYSIIRAAQFHYLVDLLLGKLARFPLLLPVPAGIRVQSIGTDDVAAELCGIVERGPGGMLPGLAGPEPMSVAKAARTWTEVRRIRKPVVAIPFLGSTAAALRRGYNTVPDRPRGQETWREWLEKRERFLHGQA